MGEQKLFMRWVLDDSHINGILELDPAQLRKSETVLIISLEIWSPERLPVLDE